MSFFYFLTKRNNLRSWESDNKVSYTVSYIVNFRQLFDAYQQMCKEVFVPSDIFQKESDDSRGFHDLDGVR